MIEWKILDDYESLSREAASILLESVDANRSIRLGLPTGSTPLGMYREVAAGCRSRYHCFENVVTFNLDEYVGLPRTDPGSYYTFMKEHLFDHVDVDRSNAHVPCGDPAVLVRGPEHDLEQALAAECGRYERLLTEEGGIDLMFLGLGSNTHIAFNEPGTPFDSRTHIVDLDESTVEANARFFPGREVPRRAITMGIGTILDSRRIVLLAAGEKKRRAIEALRSGVVSEAIPASALHNHQNVLVLCDRSAGGES